MKCVRCRRASLNDDHYDESLICGKLKTAGKISFTWFGPTPRVTITDPELVREVLSNKFGHFEKPAASPLVKLLADGLANYEGEKWARHRRILNPAFHLEKLKVIRGFKGTYIGPIS